jgi:alkylresorcinol/alkylpyrone synthase
MTLRIAEQHRQQNLATARVLGFACASPEFSIRQDDAAILAQELRVTERWLHALPALYRKSRVNHRGSVLIERHDGPLIDRQSFYKVASSESPLGPSTDQRMQVYAKRAGELLIRACRSAISNAQIPASAITHIVTVSCTGFSAPGLDIQVIQELKLQTNCARTHIGFMGCHGAINGIRVAQAIVKSNLNAVVLLGAVELCSLHQQYSDDAQQLVANSLFADGAAAMVISGTCTEDPLDDTLEDGTLPWTIASTMSQILPGTSDLMSWKINNFGFQMSLDPRVPDTIQSCLKPAIVEWLQSEELSVNEIDAWAIHPGGPRIIEATGTALGLDKFKLENSFTVLRDYGNMSSPTVLFILDRISQVHSTANSAVLLAFGPGLCMEACLLTRS